MQNLVRHACPETTNVYSYNENKTNHYLDVADTISLLLVPYEWEERVLQPIQLV
jgi:hypothetical protein